MLMGWPGHSGRPKTQLLSATQVVAVEGRVETWILASYSPV